MTVTARFNGPVRNALSFDVEDWYQGIEIGQERWGEFEKRLEIGLNAILGALDEAGAKGTFFLLGRAVEEHPELMRAIAERGHEIATHGYSHTKVYDMPLGQFEEELIRAIEVTRDATGADVKGHRAPYFSITRESYAALGVLRRHGLTYDASIFPGHNYRYGIAGTPAFPYRIEEFDLLEWPVSIMEVMGKQLGIGGAYMRILPYATTRKGIAAINAQGRPAMVYAHPWELDPRHPRIEFRRGAQVTHYFNLHSTLPRLQALLRDFAWAPAGEILDSLDLTAGVPHAVAA